jgi:hypothetical protein
MAARGKQADIAPHARLTEISVPSGAVIVIASPLLSNTLAARRSSSSA